MHKKGGKAKRLALLLRHIRPLRSPSHNKGNHANRPYGGNAIILKSRNVFVKEMLRLSGYPGDAGKTPGRVGKTY
jgi:hypothetical protein